MTIMVVGGGSGGHITPLLAVADEIKKQQPDVRIVAVTQKGSSLASMLKASGAVDDVAFVQAGKFRRYYGESKLAQLIDLKRLWLNARDMVRVALGIVGSYRLIRKEKPAVIFIKGGFVGVPIGIAASWAGVPYITHDSDVIPGLANRLIAKRAAWHAVGQNKELYAYPADKTVQVGIPLSSSYTDVTPALQAQYRRDLNIPEGAEVIMVVGGSLGAQLMDEAVVTAVRHLIVNRPNLHVLHLVGKLNEAAMDELYSDFDEASRVRIQVVGFVDDSYRYSGAADVIVTRAGATAIAEFGAQGKACIVIPNPLLTGGHQLKNAVALSEAQAVAVVEESHPEELETEINRLLDDEGLRQELADHLQAGVIRDSAARLGHLVLTVARGE